MLLKIAWRNLWVHRKKSFTALLSIIVAFVALSLFEGYLHDVSRLYDATFSQRQMLGHIIIERRSSSYPGKAGVDSEALSPEEQKWIDRHLASHPVKIRTRFLNIKGMILNGRTRSIFVGQAHDPVEGAQMREPGYRWNVLAGRALDQNTPDSSLILGRELAHVLGCKISGDGKAADIECREPSFQLQVNTERSQANAMDFEISGIMSTGFAEADSHLVVLPLSSAQKLFHTERISYLTVLLEDKSMLNEWLERFNQAATNDGQDIKAQRWQDHSFGDLFRQTMDFLKVFRNLVITIILVVVCMATINTFMKIVNERIREIGTMRSLGYRPSHVMLLFCSEAFLLAAAGSLGGMLCSWLVALACNKMQLIYNAGFLSEGVLFRIEIHSQDFIWISALLAGLTIISTLLPAWLATRRRISDILAER